MKKGIEFTGVDGKGLKVGIVVARWNDFITTPLLDECVKSLKESGVEESNITVQHVPGSYELLYGVNNMITGEKPDAVVAIGCLIKGETLHFEYIAGAVSQGIKDFNIKGDVPVIFGVLTCANEEQAVARSSAGNNHGHEWGKTAIEMARLSK